MVDEYGIDPVCCDSPWCGYDFIFLQERYTLSYQLFTYQDLISKIPIHSPPLQPFKNSHAMQNLLQPYNTHYPEASH
jgi:hypothetical protein